MRITRRHLLPASVATLLRGRSAGAELCCGPLNAKGQRLRALLDASGVDHLWQKGVHVVWDTGIPDPARPDGRPTATHCSAFAAAFAKSVGVYLLRPPQHKQELLANAQMGWLAREGAAQGWQAVPDVESAQRRANAGDLVMAAFENPNPHRAGHIAIVRPGLPDSATLAAQGPDVTQAGAVNAVSISLALGFRDHRGAWPGGVRFFSHSLAL